MNQQHRVFEKIKASAGANNDWLEQISETLNISKSAVYKRLSGDTMLSTDDLVLLMRAFDFSFDDIVFDEKKQVGFTFPYKTREIKSFMDFIEPLREFVEAAMKLPDLSFQYATNEFHFFFYLHDRDLAYFKFYMFARTVWNLSSYKGRKFDLNDFSEWVLMEKDIDHIVKSYYDISNVEIWNGNVLNNTLSQIIYALKSDAFAQADQAYKLCDKLEKMIEHISDMAENGKKYHIGSKPENGKSDISMFHNEITYTSNLLLLESPVVSQLYFAFDNPNYIMSDDPDLIQYTHDWFERIKRNALPISSAGDRNRRAFFGKIIKQIDKTREQIDYFIRHEY